jgi:phosphopantothenoylcysteine decarboxylase/phosphopantothenate--cysteine ligase
VNDPFLDRPVLLGVTGGIAAYKACEIASRLTQRGAAVDVVMTEAATRFVSPLTFGALTGRTVHSDPWAQRERRPDHVALAERSEIAIVAPATYNTLGKLAQGIADNLLVSTLAAYAKKLLLAPALNANMWAQPAFQRNLEILVERGARVCGPETGWLACGATGVGRMAEPAAILADAEAWLTEGGPCRLAT